MENWDELTVTEQVLVRRAVTGTSPRGSAQHVTAVLRWAGSPEVPRWRNASPAEELERVPELAAATRRLVADGWLTVRRALSTSFVQEDGPSVPIPSQTRRRSTRAVGGRGRSRSGDDGVLFADAATTVHVGSLSGCSTGSRCPATAIILR